MCRKMLQLKLWPVEFGCWGRWSKKEADHSLCSWISDSSGDCWHLPPPNVNFPDKLCCGWPLAAMHMCIFSSLLPAFTVPFCDHCSHWSCLLTWRSGTVLDTFGGKNQSQTVVAIRVHLAARKAAQCPPHFITTWLLYPGFEMPVSSFLTKNLLFFFFCPNSLKFLIRFHVSGYELQVLGLQTRSLCFPHA